MQIKNRRRPPPLTIEKASEITTYTHLKINYNLLSNEFDSRKLITTQNPTKQQLCGDIRGDIFTVYIPIQKKSAARGATPNAISQGNFSIIYLQEEENTIVKVFTIPGSQKKISMVFDRLDLTESKEHRFTEALKSIVSEIYIRIKLGENPLVSQDCHAIFEIVDDFSVTLKLYMNKAPGKTLSDIIRDKSTDITERLMICRELIQAFIVLQKKGVSYGHGDLSESNCLWDSATKKLMLIDISSFNGSYSRLIYHHSRCHSSHISQDLFAVCCLMIRILFTEYPMFCQTTRRKDTLQLTAAKTVYELTIEENKCLEELFPDDADDAVEAQQIFNTMLNPQSTETDEKFFLLNQLHIIMSRQIGAKGTKRKRPDFFQDNDNVKQTNKRLEAK